MPGSFGQTLRSLSTFGAVAIVIVLAACGGDKKTIIQGAPPPGTPTSSNGGTTACDPSKCLSGNECLPFNGETKCRKTCSSNDDPATSCPFNYRCADTDPENEVAPFCVALTDADGNAVQLEHKESGQWGAACQANLGSKNSECDGDQGFFCFGLTPTDGNAYCTRYGCTTDAECGPGFGCADVNTTPNVGTAKRKVQSDPALRTQRLCIRRDYCSECTSDIDCTKISGVTQHCITDTAGRGFCTQECTANQGCPNEARCATVEVGTGTAKICYPRSTVCVGDGTLCSPCHSDQDCGEDGICTHGQYTTEKFCAKLPAGGDCAKCPKQLTTPARKTGCTKSDDDLLPKGYCVGIYNIGGAPVDLGCWTPDR